MGSIAGDALVSTAREAEFESRAILQRLPDVLAGIQETVLDVLWQRHNPRYMRPLPGAQYMGQKLRRAYDRWGLPLRNVDGIATLKI